MVEQHSGKASVSLWVVLLFDHLTDVANGTSGGLFKGDARCVRYTSADLHVHSCWGP